MKNGTFLKGAIIPIILLIGCKSNDAPQAVGSPYRPDGTGQMMNQILLTKPGVVQVRFRQGAVRMLFTPSATGRGLERLRLGSRELAVLDSLGLVMVRRVKPQLEEKSGDQISVSSEASLREKLGKPARKGKAMAAFKGIERDMILTFPPNQSLDVLCRILERFPSVERCQSLPHRRLLVPIIPNDPQFSSQLGFNNTAAASATQAPNFDIDAPEAWEVQKGDASVIVAVVDDGVDVRHPDLYEKIWINTNELPAAFVTAANGLSSDAWPNILTFKDLNAFSADAATQSSMAALRSSNGLIDANGNGYIDGEDLYNAFRDGLDSDPPATAGEVDDIAGWDFQNNDPIPLSSGDHGTAVAGLVGATTDNGLDVAGVGWNTRIMAIYGDWSWPSVEYAIKHGANIITSSLDPNSSSSTLEALLADLNTERIPFTAALGNVNRYVGGTVYAESPYTIAISNFRSMGIRDQSGGSAFSVNTDVAGPGTGTWSLTTPSGSAGFGGTSGANPIIAGTLSLVVAQRAGLTAEQYRQILRKSAVDVPVVTGDLGENTPGFDYYSGWGLANAKNALTMAVTDPWAEAKITSQRVSYWAINRREEMHIVGSTESVTAFAGIPGGGSSQVLFEWAPGAPPAATTWSSISSASIPYVSDASIGTLNRSALATGVNTMRLTVTTGGLSFVDYGRVDVPHAYMDLKDNTLFIRNIELKGFAFHPQFASYELQVASGHGADPDNASLWSVVGTSTTARPPIPGGIGLTDQVLFSSVPLSSLPNGDATLQLVVRDASNSKLASYAVPIIVDNTVFPYQSGFPVSISYPYRFGGPAASDLTGDGIPELVVTDQCNIHVRKNNGTLLAGWPVYIGNDKVIASSPAIGDISGDGLPEIVVRANNYDSRKDILYVFGSNGSPITPWPLDPGTFPGDWRTNSWGPNTPVTDFAPVLADLDSDGDLEILLAGQPENASAPSGVFAFQGDGSLWRSYTIPGAVEVPVSPACGDIDADGELDLVVVTKQGTVSTITAWHADGTQMFSNSLPTSTSWYYPMSLVLADLDGDRDLEIVLQMFAGHLRAFHHDGSIVTGWNDVTFNGVSYSMSVGDITPSDGNDQPSIIVSYFRDVDASPVYDFEFGITAISPNGTVIPGWGSLIDKGDIAQQPIVVDVDNDGVMEVLAGSFRQYDASGQIDPPFTAMKALNDDGTLLSDNRFPLYFAGGLTRSPVIADLDHDGDLEISVASNKWGGPLEVFDLDALDDAGAIAWGMHLHDPLRSSNYHGGIRILEPTATRPTDVGPPNDASARNSLLIRFRNELPFGVPDASNLTVRIGTAAAPVAAVTRVEGEIWLLAVPPDQAATGLYKLELEWNDGGVHRMAGQKDAIRYSPSAEPTDQALVVDRSGSMSMYEKYLATRTAANFYASERGSLDNVGIVTFNTQATDEIPGMLLLGPDGSANRSQIATEINTTPSPSGMTSIGQGLRKALLDVLPVASPGRKRALVLLSDGLENTAPFWETGSNPVNQLFEQPENQDVVIHTIALGPDADRDLHDRIAAATGGTSRFVYLGTSISLYGRLADAYKQVDEIVKREQRVFTAAESIAVGIHKTYSIHLPSGAMSASLSISYRNPMANVDVVEVRKPDGTVIPAGGMTIINGYSSKVFTLSAPPAGTYQVTIVPQAIGTEVLTTASIASAQTLVASLAWPEPVGGDGMRANLLAAVLSPQTMKVNTASSMQVTARIVAPDKSVTVIPLHDNGTNRDGAAGDGIYGAPVILGIGGGYAITVIAVTVNPLKPKSGSAVLERTIGFFQPRAKDSDTDGMDDTWEQHSFPGMAIKTINPLSDHDADGLTALEEFRYRTNPQQYDSDGDGRPDGAEVDGHTDPLASDPRATSEEDRDGDGLPDAWEKRFFPELEPSSVDGRADADGDKLSNYTEWRLNTNPCWADTDGNGITDDVEAGWQNPRPSVRTERPTPAQFSKFVLPLWLIVFLILVALVVLVLVFVRRA